MASVEQTPAVYIIAIFAILLCEVQVNGQVFYAPQIEALSPTGLRLTFENTGFTKFVFMGHINRHIQLGEVGSISKALDTPPEAETLTFTLNVPLKIGDTIYYYIFFESQKGTELLITDLEYKVTKFLYQDNRPAEPVPLQLPLSTEEDNDDNTSRTPSLFCTVSITEMKGKIDVCEGSLIFSEEFSQEHPSELTQWDALNQFIGEPAYSFNMYRPDETISLKDGFLVITPILTESIVPPLLPPLDLSDRCTGKLDTLECKRDGAGIQLIPPVITGKITTRRTFSFKYGRVEIRAKLPAGKWILPEINLEPTDYIYGWDNYASGLVRIAFSRNDVDPGVRNYVLGGPIYSGSKIYNALFLATGEDDNYFKYFHNYSMTWTPEILRFQVDGKATRTYGYDKSNAEDLSYKIKHASNWKKGTKMAPFDEMFHLTLGLRVGGVNEYKDSDSKPWKNLASKAMIQFWRAKEEWLPSWSYGAMMIDYVKVYAL
ncbi:beta-1,3-glucan-binding protein-like [Helicoverpa armigera]|uniref:beta-1,3-glucan-binding protein-like n=1 Tax=Helicoverpa armigera TaxID=29058 RepID=UPI003082EDF5